MIGLWIAAAMLSASAGALMLWRAAAGAGPRADPTLAAHRRALAEIGELAELGLLPASEQGAARAEAARRLLRAADRAPDPGRRTAASGAVVLAISGLTAAAALAIYLAIGSPSLPDQPSRERLAAWRANPETAPPAGLAAALAEVAKERPGDPEPLRRLAALDLGLGDADGAMHALRQAMARAPASADLPAMLGEVMVLANQGNISPDAAALFGKALQHDPAQPAARYYLARAKIAEGRTGEGLADWRALLVALPSGDARRTSLASEIAEVEKTGQLPPAQQEGRAPDLGPQVRAMVDGLAARLRVHPDDPAGWVRLVRAYAVLGRAAERDQALAAARARYAGRPEVLAQLDAAAKANPVANLAR